MQRQRLGGAEQPGGAVTWSGLTCSLAAALDAALLYWFGENPKVTTRQHLADLTRAAAGLYRQRMLLRGRRDQLVRALQQEKQLTRKLG
jgi:hypothetical protein